jgi:hypothetical protein
MPIQSCRLNVGARRGKRYGEIGRLASCDVASASCQALPELRKGVQNHEVVEVDEKSQSHVFAHSAEVGGPKLTHRLLNVAAPAEMKRNILKRFIIFEL